jgi:hypothetical protein
MYPQQYNEQQSTQMIDAKKKRTNLDLSCEPARSSKMTDRLFLLFSTHRLYAFYFIAAYLTVPYMSYFLLGQCIVDSLALFLNKKPTLVSLS